MPLPFAHGLLGATIVAMGSTRSLRRDWRVLSIGAALGVLPDFDYLFFVVLGLGEGWHRTFTHSTVFAIMAGVIAGAHHHADWLKMAPIYSLATLSHALLDAFTSKNSGGVQIFWPLSRERIRFGLVDYPELIGTPAPPFADIVLQFLTTTAVELAIFAPVFLATLWLNRRMATQRR